MQYPRPLANLIKQANTMEGLISDRTFKMFATIITPEQQIPLIIPTGFARLSAFSLNHSDDCQIKGQLQPGVYLHDVLPFKDNLYMEVVIREGLDQTVRRYRAVPLGDNNPEVSSSSSGLANMKSKDTINITGVTFQLLDQGYALLKNEMVSDIFLMAKLDNVLHDQFVKFGSELKLTDADEWRGVEITSPIDNSKVFRHVVIPSGVPLVKLPSYLQNHDEFGIYSTGLGSYYRNGLWYVYPLFRLGQYDTAKKVLNIYRLPQDVFPTIKRSWFEEGKVITILSTGGGVVKDGRDVGKQNQGTGKRIISSDAVLGDSGVYYNKGQAVTTRGDRLTEVQTSTRGSGEEMVPFHSKPTNNICKLLSQNAYNEGIEISVEWHNSDSLLIVPGMPLKFYYMSGEEKLVYREGTVLICRSEFRRDINSTEPVFREFSSLTLFLDKEEFE